MTHFLNRLAAGLKGKRPKEQGPVGDAVEILRAVIAEAKKQGRLQDSIILKSTDVLLDYTHNVTGALAVAVDIVNAIEEGGEWSPVKAKTVHLLLQKFKLEAVKARLHQHVPAPRAEPFEKKEDLPS